MTIQASSRTVPSPLNVRPRPLAYAGAGAWSLARRGALAGLQRAFSASLAGKRRDFLTGALSGGLERVQGAKLAAFLASNAQSRYGRDHGYAEITTLESWRARVPIVDYDDLETRVGRVASGHARELTDDSVIMLERTGGSTSTNKLIPYTKGLKDEFSAATDVWMADLYARIPSLLGTTCYFAISPVGPAPRATEGGLPIGFEDDTEYFHPIVRILWRRMLAVPAEVARIGDMEEWRFATCRALLADDALGILSVWSPTFLSGLLDFLEARFDDLVATLPSPRARALLRARSEAGGRLSGRALWPRLAVVSCWADGVSREFALPLRAFFRGVHLQPKGLLATEGVVTFPLCGPAVGPLDAARWDDPDEADTPEGAYATRRVLAYTSHFFEFLDLDSPSRAPLLAHELRVGGNYSPLLTTAGGFARYHLKDALACTGTHAGVPTLRFIGKTDRTADLFGEKINMRQVERGLEIARTRTGASWRFALLAPVDSPWRYMLFVESDEPERVLERVARVLEEHLLTGHHYAYCRKLGQLHGLQWRRVNAGREAFERGLVEAGLRAGTIKPAVLDARTHWADIFAAP